MSWSWNWKKFHKLLPLFAQFLAVQNGELTWMHNDSKFSIFSVYDAFRTHLQKPSWQRVLWAAPAIPKHCFVSWMAIRNRLPTIDRLNSWVNIMIPSVSFVEWIMKPGIIFSLIAVMLKKYGINFYNFVIFKGIL